MHSTTPTCFHCGTPLALDDTPIRIGGGWGRVHCCGAAECLAVLDALARGVERERSLEELARRDEQWERERRKRL